MRKTLVEKIISHHHKKSVLKVGEEIELKATHTLIQDSTGTMAALQFESIGISRVQTELSVCFIDHNTFQEDYKNMEDHQYLQSFSSKFGLIFSKAGNGICHQVFLERFAKPGKILLGSDSHTPTSGGVGMLSIGAGGLDVAAAMAGEPFKLKMPQVIGVELTGKLKPMVSAKDVALEVLRILGTNGGVGKILEYFGPGVKTLSIPERSTITNVGTETGATTSIFPSDKLTKKFLTAQNRSEDWVNLEADPEVNYEENIKIDLDEIEPLIALPHSPGNVVSVKEVEGLNVDQVCIGSCTNSSLRDILIVAQIIKNNKVNDEVSLVISPGSRQVLQHLIKTGDLNSIIDSGARILECTCGPCIGMGQAPSSGAISLRTFNRNFKGRSGTEDAKVYLVSPETAAVSALFGKITDPRKNTFKTKIKMPKKFIINNNLLISPSQRPSDFDVIKGKNIKPFPIFKKIPDKFSGEVLLKLGDNITTDDILPANAHILPLRSNIPEISRYTFSNIKKDFYNNALNLTDGLIIAGENYGQGSSREHAAITTRYLGINAIIAKSYSRIHASNLINFGVLPLIFADTHDYDVISEGDKIDLDISNLENLKAISSSGQQYSVRHELSNSEIEMIKAGGKMELIRKNMGILKCL